jgi:hypothetical protein
MVKNDPVRTENAHFAPFRSEPEEADYDIFDVPAAHTPGQGYASARGCLACYRDFSVPQFQTAGYHPAYIKYNYPGPFLIARPLKAARAFGIQIGHMDDRTSASALGNRAESLCPGKGRKGFFSFRYS